MAEGYSIKDMQQLMMAEQKVQREILDKQTEQLEAIRVHLKELNGKVARHQETIYEKERGLIDRLVKIEGWQIKVAAGAAVITGLAVFLIEHFLSRLA